MPHFELTDETTELLGGTVLHRIRATVDLPQHGVTAGDLGGWVEHEGNLGDTAWIGDEAQVHGDALLTGNARVYGSARVFGNARVYGDAALFDRAQVYGTAQVYGKAVVHGDAVVYGAAQVYGSARLYGGAAVGGNAVVCDRAGICDAATVSGTAWVRGNALVRGRAEIIGDAMVYESQHVLVLGPVGSENRWATLVRTDGGGHVLKIGCWTGTIDELPGEVDRRAASWSAPDADTARWGAEYAALVPLLRARVRMWEHAHA